MSQKENKKQAGLFNLAKNKYTYCNVNSYILYCVCFFQSLDALQFIFIEDVIYKHFWPADFMRLQTDFFCFSKLMFVQHT